ncbi:hypothetical protein OSTOST_11960 [Ostertagia ostertagi]
MIMAERAADCLAKLGLDGSMHNNDIPSQPSHLQPSFGHHRRCRSLRERTGVDHRLERLPSGPINKTPLYTVITGVNTNKSRPVKIADFAEHVRMMAADSDFRLFRRSMRFFEMLDADNHIRLQNCPQISQRTDLQTFFLMIIPVFD